MVCAAGLLTNMLYAWREKRHSSWDPVTGLKDAQVVQEALELRPDWHQKETAPAQLKKKPTKKQVRLDTRI